MRRRRKKSTDNYELDVDNENVLIGFEEKKKNFLLEKDFGGLENLLQTSLQQVQYHIYQNRYGKALTEICQKSLILLEDIKRQNHRIDERVFNTINLLDSIYELEQTADELDEEIDNSNYEGHENEAKESELERIEEVVSFLVKVFNNYAQYYPKNIEVPSSDILDFILTIENDWDFELLLIGLARTENPRVIKILEEFAQDTEKDVRELARMLLTGTQKNFNNTNKDELKTLVAEGKLVMALKKLLDIGKSNGNVDFANEIYFQLGRNSTLEKDLRLGIISFQDSDRTRNQILFSVIELIDQI